MASLSDFTNKPKFENLIISIDRDITSRSASNMLINDQMYAIGGGTLATKPTISPIGNATIDGIANKISSETEYWKSSLKNWEDSKSSSLGLDRPGVVNLSEDGPINTSTFNAQKIINYLPPTNIALSGFEKLGKDLDLFIKDSLKIQTYGTKGTEILCTSLCLIMSILPCQLTNKIVDDIQKIKDLQSQIQTGTNMAVAAEKFGLSELNTGFSGGVTGLANIKDVNKSLTEVFKKNNNTNNKNYNATETIRSITSTIAMVTQTISLLLNVVKLGQMDPMMLKGYILNGLFDMLENVLMAVQSMALQIVDNIMNKVIAPIEKYFNKNTFPARCGIGGQVLFKKILTIIYNFKNKILQFIADLFAFQKSTHTKFKLFNDNMLWTLELNILLKTLNLLSNNFIDITIACGIGKRPCSGESKEDSIENLSRDFVNDTAFSEDGINFTNTVILESAVPSTKDINSIVKKIQPMVNSLFPGLDTQVYPGEVRTELKNLPTLITKMMKDINLGSSFAIYTGENKATVIYNNQSLCGAN